MRRLGERFDRGRRWRQVGIARAEVDDIDPAAKKVSFARRNVRERIRRKTINSVRNGWHGRGARKGDPSGFWNSQNTDSKDAIWFSGSRIGDPYFVAVPDRIRDLREIRVPAVTIAVSGFQC